MVNHYATLFRLKIGNLLFLLVIGIVAFPQLFGKIPDNLEVENFSIYGNNENGATNWVLHGRFALVKESIVYFSEESIISQQKKTNIKNDKPGLTAIFFDFKNKSKETFTLTTSKCQLNTTSRQCSSEEKVTLKSEDIDISGIGFDLWFDKEAKLIIHNKVHIKLKNIKNLNTKYKK